MRKKLKSKYCILIAIVIALGIFLININSKKPIIKFHLIKPNSSHVIFNNYSTEETLKKAKKLVEEKGEIQKGYALYKSILKKESNKCRSLYGNGLCLWKNKQF